MDESAQPECELLFEDGDDLEALQHKCPKNPGHKNFIPINELQPHHVPTDDPEEARDIIDWIRYKSHLTVKIVVRGVSKDRPKTYYNSRTPYPYSEYRGFGTNRLQRCGTGCLSRRSMEHINKSCPCPQCQKQDGIAKIEYWTFTIRTAGHVIFDEYEAKNCIVECFFDSQKAREVNNVKMLYGMGLFQNSGYSPKQMTKRVDDIWRTDEVQVMCVTHDEDLIASLEALRSPDSTLEYSKMTLRNFGFIISHPHGLSKVVTFGRMINLIAHGGDNELEGKCRLPLLPWSGVDGEKGGGDKVVCTERDEIDSVNSKPICEMDNPSTNENSTSSSSASSFFNLTPGTEFDLPQGLTFDLPHDTTFNYPYTDSESTWYSLPKGTRFRLQDGRELFLPPEAEFYAKTSCSECYFTYDIDTCPGSSGATIYVVNSHNKIEPIKSHFGANLDKTGLTGIRGLSF